jgi:hypothetical protein
MTIRETIILAFEDLEKKIGTMKLSVQERERYISAIEYVLDRLQEISDYEDED